MRLCLACSSGGHFLQLYSLGAFWRGSARFWVTHNAVDTAHLLSNERVYWGHFPTNRNAKNLVLNLHLAWRLLRLERPDAVVSTGAGIAVPFIYVARLMGIKTVYLESLTRTSSLSLSGRLVYRVADHFLVQWPELAEKLTHAEFVGQVI